MAIVSETVKPYKKQVEGSVLLQGKTCEYTLIAEDHVLKNEKGQAEATAFSFSYLAKREEKNRPIIFAFNGGPGASSFWLHLGFYGPMVTDDLGGLMANEDCLLDVCDIVLIDPVNTGYARIYPEVDYSSYFTALSDAKAVAKFIREWLKEHGREESPFYLSGESYGATRASLCAALLKDLNVRGIFYIGPGYSSDWEAPRTLKDFIPATAAAWYHGKSGKGKELEAFKAEAREFQYGTYLHALYQGDFCSEEDIATVSDKLAYFTSLPADYFKKNHLLFSREDFLRMLLADEKKTLGRYDMRYTQTADEEGDAFMNVATPAYERSAKTYFEDILGLNTHREYIYTNYDVNVVWDYESDPTMAGALAEAMEAKPKMQVFFATGDYDIVATLENTRFSISHSRVPMERVHIREYPSGHMVYSDRVCRRALAEDIRSMLIQNDN